MRKYIIKLIDKLPMIAEGACILGLIFIPGLNNKIIFGFLLLYFQIESIYMTWVDSEKKKIPYKRMRDRSGTRLCLHDEFGKMPDGKKEKQ